MIEYNVQTSGSDATAGDVVYLGDEDAT